MIFGLALTASAFAAAPNFGPNVVIFDPSMPLSQIQARVDAIAAQQGSNEFGTERYAIFFRPGTYGSLATPLNFQLGYYTAVAGLGSSPSEVVINGSVNVYNRCFASDNCHALTNFWRSLSNLTINVRPASDCQSDGDFWAVSHGSSMRRVNVTGGTLTLMDYCTPGPQYANGSFIADSQTNFVVNGSQEEFLIRNSNIGGWSNAVWNQVFSGVTGAPAQTFPTPAYTVLAASPVTRETPYLYTDSAGTYFVFLPAVQTNSVGASWANGPTTGLSLPLSSFYIAQPADTAAALNRALSTGKNLLLTPGVYSLNQTLQVTRPDTVVLGLGFATLVPQNGIPAMIVENAKGMLVSGLIFDAGLVNSPYLLQFGTGPVRSDGESTDPSLLSDVSFRIGGATPGKATNSLIANTKNLILDNIWAWRADHGNGVGWTSNTADQGIIVNASNVTAYGLFVDHYQKYGVLWNGAMGTNIFLGSEMPADVPSQPAWARPSGGNGYPVLKVNDLASSFHAFGTGCLYAFQQNIVADRAFEVPATLAPGSLQSMMAVNLSLVGTVTNVVNNTGGTSPNITAPANVVSFP